MILQRLKEHYPRIGESPVGYIPTFIKWIIQLDSKGKYLGIVETSSGQERGRDRGKVFDAPNALKTSGIVAKLLSENRQYVFGLNKEDTMDERSTQRHDAFINGLKSCFEATGNAMVNAVLKFIESGGQKKIDIKKISPADNISFAIDGVMPIDEPDIREYWAQKCSAETGEKAECLICGRARPPLERLPIKIKRIRGGQPSGTQIISANDSAFESYGLEHSLIAPVCYQCAEESHKALNFLIRSEQTRIFAGPLTYVFWTRKETSFSIVSLLSDPRPEDVRVLIESATTGRQGSLDIDEDAFYALSLSAAGGRTTIRDWLETTIGNIKKNLVRYFSVQKIYSSRNTDYHPLPMLRIIDATVPFRNNRADREKLSPQVPRTLFRFAINGGKLPMWLLQQALARCRAEQRVSVPRAALVKMVLLSQKDAFKEDYMAALDADEKNPAYLCGRLLQVIGNIQQRAIGAETTVVDRYYGGASSSPQTVFPTLLRGVQNHLAKLRKDPARAGYAVAVEKKLGQIMSGLHQFPKILTLEQQGLFALGYYHQREADFTKKQVDDKQ